MTDFGNLIACFNFLHISLMSRFGSLKIILWTFSGKVPSNEVKHSAISTLNLIYTFPKSVKLRPPPDCFQQIFGHPPQFFPLFASYKQNLATRTQFFTAILAQTDRNVSCRCLTSL